MSFINTLESEFLKTKRTAVIYLPLIVGILIPVIMFLGFVFSNEDFNSIKPDPWNRFFAQGRQGFVILLLPMFVLLSCTMLPQIEFRNNTWKFVHTSPQSRFNLYLAKYLVILLMIFVFQCIHILFMFVALLLANVVDPELDLFAHTMDWYDFFQNFGKSYIVVLGLSGMLFWMGMRFKNFIVTIGIGIACWFTAMMMIFEMHTDVAEYFPFSYPVLSFLPKYFDRQLDFQYSSLWYALAFFVLGFLEFNYRKSRA